MASTLDKLLDKLRQYTATLEAVASSAKDIQRELERVRAELPPLVEKLREVSAGRDQYRRQKAKHG